MQSGVICVSVSHFMHPTLLLKRVWSGKRRHRLFKALEQTTDVLVIGMRIANMYVSRCRQKATELQQVTVICCSCASSKE